METGQDTTSIRAPQIVSRSDSNAERLYAGLEVYVLIVLFFGGVWGTYLNGINGWVVAARLLFVLVLLGSLAVRRPDWRARGFRLDNIGAVWNRAILTALAALLMVLFIASAVGYPIVPISPWSVLMTVLSGLAQQAVVLGYFFVLWETALKRSVLAAVANSTLFGVIHVPDTALVILAGLGGLLLHLIFLRGRNIYVIGLMHGVFSILLLPAFLSQDLMKTPKIGPSELLPFSRRIMRDSGPDSRVAICSRLVAGDVFRDSFNRRVARIFRGLNDDQARRERLLDFLAADERVYCVITARELRTLTDPSLERRSHPIAEGWIWRKSRAAGEPIFGNSFLEMFVERVILISNRPSVD
jgi:membrane protease YdiL (CAAX protease family)